MERHFEITMDAKQQAAERAVDFIEDGMTVGLGTGSTASFAIHKIGERVKNGLKIRAIPTSEKAEKLAVDLKIPLAAFPQIDYIDITIDGADEVDKKGNLIKGGGGALLREKIVAFNSRRLIIVVDESKQVQQLGRFRLPIEILPFGASATLKQIEKLGCQPQIRKESGKPFTTDNGNLIADCSFYPIKDPALLNMQLHTIPGVVETGLFLHNMVNTIITGLYSGKVMIRKME